MFGSKKNQFFKTNIILFLELELFFWRLHIEAVYSSVLDGRLYKLYVASGFSVDDVGSLATNMSASVAIENSVVLLIRYITFRHSP